MRAGEIKVAESAFIEHLQVSEANVIAARAYPHDDREREAARV